MMDVLDLTDPSAAKIQKGSDTKLAPILKRQSTLEIKSGCKIPDQWKLDGDLSLDPIAESLLVRINEDVVTGSAKAAPIGHTIMQQPKHMFDVKPGMMDVLDLTDPSAAKI